MEKGHCGVLIDPFFSNPSLGQIVTASITHLPVLKANACRVRQGLAAIKARFPHAEANTKAIVVSHGHYDHLLDVPAVYHELGRRIEVYANQSSINTCSGVIDRAHLKNLDSGLPPERPFLCLPAGTDTLRLYRFKARHNPHIKPGIKLYNGHLDSPYTCFTNAYQATNVWKWKEGQAYSFMLDVADSSGQIKFRVFIQSSCCDTPHGLPPANLPHWPTKKVDVAFLCVASHHFTPQYPTPLIKAVAPETAVWFHWENFFRSSVPNPKTVFATNVDDFFGKEAVRKFPVSYLPYPQATLTFKY